MTGSFGLTLSPLLPWPVTAAFAALALALVVLSAWKGARGTGLRALGLALLLLVLLNPRISEAEREARPDIALIVLDRSESQSTGDRPARTIGALEALRAMAGRFTDLELRVVEAGSQGEGTRLFGPLARALGRVPEGRFAGAVMVTDGQVHDAPSSPLPGPLHVLLTGDPDERDRRLVIEKAPAYGLVGKEVTLRFRIERTGGGAARPIGVTFRHNGRPAGGTRLRPGESGRFSFTIDHAGPSVVELVAEEAPDEASTDNNRAAVTVQGVRDRLKVALVSGMPHPGERAWRNLFKSDPLVDLVHFTILRPPTKQDATPITELSLIPFPVDELFEKKLADFDLLVLDRYVVRGVLRPKYLNNVARFIDGGGALLVAAGPELAGPRGLGATRLAELLPARPSGGVVEGAFRPRLTEAGGRHPVTELGADQETWGRWFRRLEVEVKRGTALMEDDGGRPLLVLDELGKGRVALLLSDHLWLWARGFDGGGPHIETVRRLAHWLMREPELEAEALTARVRQGRIEIERRTLARRGAPVTVVSPSGKTRRVVLEDAGHGRWQRDIAADEVGLWRIEGGDRTALATAPPADPLEASETTATAEHLTPITAKTGGSVSWLSEGIPNLRRVAPDRTASGRDWIGLVKNRAEAVTGLAQRPVLPAPLLLGLALVALIGAWWQEAR